MGGRIARFDDRRLAILDGWLQRGVERRSFAGGVVAIAALEGPVHTLPFGSVRTADGVVPARADHRFLLTSITKTLTALQVLTLIEAGEATLETPVSAYVPQFAARGKDRVLLWHVLTHTSGIDDEVCNTAEGPDLGLTAADHLSAVNDAPLAAPPGTRVGYCSPPFWALAEMISACTGLHHADHLRSAVTAPLGLAGTGYEPGTESPSGYVAAEIADVRHQHLAEQVRRCAYPAGGIVGTAEDLVRYGRMLLGGGAVVDGTRVLAPPTVALLRQPWTVGLPGLRDYEGGVWRTERGLGWALGGPGDLRSDGTLWHSGGSGTSMWVDPAVGVVLVLLTATWFLPRDVLGRLVNVALAAVSGSPRRRSR